MRYLLFGIVTSSMCLLSPVIARADLRLWTDIAGNKLRAEYTGMHLGHALLRSSKSAQPQPVYFFVLSEDDQQYLRDLLKAQNKEKLIPNIGASRIWTRNTGATFEGQFLGMQNGQVDLWVANQKVSYDAGSLLPADRAYIAETLQSWGLAANVDPGTPFVAGMNNPGNGNFVDPYRDTALEHSDSSVGGSPVDVGPPSDVVSAADPRLNPVKVGLDDGSDSNSPADHGDAVAMVTVPDPSTADVGTNAPETGSDGVPSVGRRTPGFGSGFAGGTQSYAPPAMQGSQINSASTANGSPQQAAPASSSTRFAPVSDGGGPVKTIAIVLGVLAVGAMGFRWYQNREYNSY